MAVSSITARYTPSSQSILVMKSLFSAYLTDAPRRNSRRCGEALTEGFVWPRHNTSSRKEIFTIHLTSAFHFAAKIFHTANHQGGQSFAYFGPRSRLAALLVAHSISPLRMPES